MPKEIKTLLLIQDLPLGLRRASSAHPTEELRIASKLCGAVAHNHQDEVICSCLIRRNLAVPAHQGAAQRRGSFPR